MTYDLCIAGICEFCIFPFLHKNDHAHLEERNNEEVLTYDCVTIPFWGGNAFCPTAVYKNNSKPYGTPYLWACPKDEHQLHPSCYESPDNGYINVSIV